ncbi:MAG: PDZ domain-containing protein, partial [Deltaproteobacteria bacterium]|nr:PDZ domain-containing protein [Deltaproteobacteria bacterium]
MTNQLRRFWKPVVIALSVAAGFYLTIEREGLNGLDIDVNSSSHADTGSPRAPYDLSQLRVLNRVILLAKEHYIDRSRIQPRQMLLSGLDYVQKQIAEVLVRHEESSPTVTVQVDTASRTFRLDDVDSPWALSFRFKEIFRFVQANLTSNDVDLRDVEYAAVNGMLHTLDPHSTLLVPDVYNEMRMSTRGEFGGLGIVISIRDQELTVISPIDGTPAARAGLRRMDRIVKIGEESTINMTLTEAVNRLRGPPGTTVQVWIMRRGWTEPRRFDLQRAIIHIESVEARMLEGNVGYVRIKNFQGNTYEDLQQHLGELRAQGVRGLVLDLRNNPGGLLEQAVQVADAFLTSGTIVTTAGNSNEERDEKFAQAEGTEPNYPMVVLVNGGSASASEIVAGALKNHDRALIVGERSFGKGSVQNLYDFDDGSALKLTIAQYLTPGDVSIQSVGIVPDIEVDAMIASRDRVDLVPTPAFLRESDLQAHLTHANAAEDTNPTRVLRFLQEREEHPEGPGHPGGNRRDEEDDEEDPEAFKMDFEISLSRDILARATRSDRRELLSEARQLLDRREADELAKLARELGRLGVDWSGGTDDGASEVAVTATIGRRGEEIPAGEEFRLRVTVQNRGSKTLRQLRAITKSDNPVLDDLELVFGKLGPGQSRTWEVPSKVPRDMPTRIDQVELTFGEQHGHVPPPTELRVKMLGLPRPAFEYGVHLADNVRGNGDGRIQPGEQVTIYVAVKNTGAGRSYETQANVKNLSGEGVLLRAGRFQLDDMRPGETRRGSFTIEVLPAFDGREFKLELSIADTDLREFIAEQLVFPVGGETSAVTAEDRVVAVRSDTEVRESAAQGARVVGRLATGSTVRSMGRSGALL